MTNNISSRGLPSSLGSATDFPRSKHHIISTHDLGHNALAEDIVRLKTHSLIGAGILTESLSSSSALPQYGKGVHLITENVLRECSEALSKVDIGIFTLNCLHTSAGLTVSCIKVDIL